MFDGYGLLGFGVVGNVASATVMAPVLENVVAAAAGPATTTKAATSPTPVPAAIHARRFRPVGREVSAKAALDLLNA
jgi:hypothetical protein